MSTLDHREKRKLEQLFGMSSGYVLENSYSDRTFGDLIADTAGLDIHSDRYLYNGTSKAKKFRAFWELESDAVVGKVLQELIIEVVNNTDPQLLDECRGIVARLLAGGPNLGDLTEIATRFDAKYLQREINRMEAAVESDPELAIGTAKELIETCCKTILQERDVTWGDNQKLSALTKATFKQLRLTREDVPDSTRGADAIRRLLSNLGSIANDLNELRNLYGTGHGKPATTSGLSPRHREVSGRISRDARTVSVREPYRADEHARVSNRFDVISGLGL